MPLSNPGSASIPLVTALPTNASDGQQCIFVDSTSAPTYWWLLRYVAAKSSNKWVCFGGTFLESSVSTDESTTTTSTWLNLATDGPKVTAPLTGSYEVMGLGGAYQTGGGNVCYIGIAIGDTTPGTNSSLITSTTSFASVPPIVTTYNSVTANDVMKLRYYMTASGTGHWNSRTIRIRASAVGG